MISWNDFDKIWASTSPLTPYEFSDPNYSQGWNFVGSTPPARQMWDSIQKKNDEKFKYLRDNFGTPNIVTQASQMTDTEKVYVYIGSEAGWNSGHWYYYDEDTSSWEDGGVYNSVAFITDTTLSIAGQPADAKAVGDALALKADLAGCTFTGNVNVTAYLSVTGISTLAGDVTASSDLSVAGDSSLTNLSVSGTTALTGTSTAPTPSADDNSTKIATTEYVQNEVKPIETDVDIAQKDIANIKALLQGHLYDYQTDSTSAYTKSVPAGALPYAGLEKVGGKTVVMNQLLQNGNFTDTSYWGARDLTMSVSDGVATLTFDGSNSVAYIENVTGAFDKSHKYYMSADINNSTSANAQFNLYGVDTVINQVNTPASSTAGFVRQQRICTGSSGTESRKRIFISNITSAGTVQVKNVYFIDLTLMFGAGNEPSTVAEVGAILPADYYAYNAGSLLSAGVTEVESRKNINNQALAIRDANTARTEKLPIQPSATYNVTVEQSNIDVLISEVYYYKQDESYLSYVTVNSKSITVTAPSNAYYILLYIVKPDGSAIPSTEYPSISAKVLSLINTYPIPTAIRNLEGYGWSAGTAYNYIDYERKKFVKCVGKADLGSLNWGYYADGTNNSRFASSNAFPNIKGSANDAISNIIVPLYQAGTFYDIYYHNKEKVIHVGTDGKLSVYDSSQESNPDNFKNYLTGVYCYYELATPVETDISQYLTDDNLIQVESGGTLTFENQHGDDYRLPVPSEETYMVDLQASLGG